LPPLRDRGNDIVILSKHFINEFCKENSLRVKTLSKSAVEKLIAYSFPGNVRELKSVIELAITLSDTDEISSEDILLGSNALIEETIDKELSLREYNIRVVKRYLEKYDGNIKLVAEKLDIGVATIYRMLKEENED
jgi:DNA-binding NtrC family response regulator